MAPCPQATFSHLAIASTRRTALLCSRPQPLSYWALEILRDKAEQALKLVQKWDNSTLGLADLLVDEVRTAGVGSDLLQGDGQCNTLQVRGQGVW